MPTKRKDGRYQSSVILENPITGEKVRRYFYAYTLQELEAERRRIMNANISDFLQVETFHRFADEFIAMKRDVDKLEASTLSTYQGFLNRHILPQIPQTMKLADIKPALLKHILAQIDGDRTRQAVYTLLQSIFRAAKFERLIENNPMEYIRKPKHKATAAGIVTPEIYHALLDAIRGSQTEHLFKFAWDTGLRRGEIVALRWSHGHTLPGSSAKPPRMEEEAHGDRPAAGSSSHKGQLCFPLPARRDAADHIDRCDASLRRPQEASAVALRSALPLLPPYPRNAPRRAGDQREEDTGAPRPRISILHDGSLCTQHRADAGGRDGETRSG